MACGFSPEGAGVEKKQSDPWIPTWPGEEITSRRDSNFGLRFRAAGPRAGGSSTDLIPAFNPCPPFLTTRLSESFVLGVRRGSLRAPTCCSGHCKGGSAPRRPVLPSWRRLVHAR
ncbi:L-arabinose-responsive transcription regulator ARA1 [Fusarium oxysporum f. sp. albedinis]|nr:L-arabinose-responsive transcription regulator ARA1 [Fusarium oxysporum f. sp. albedinis]